MKKIIFYVTCGLLLMSVIFVFSGFNYSTEKYIEFTWDDLPDANSVDPDKDYKQDNIIGTDEWYKNINNIEDKKIVESLIKEAEYQQEGIEKSIKTYDIVNKLFNSSFTYENTMSIPQKEWDFVNFICNTLEKGSNIYSEEEYSLIEWYLFSRIWTLDGSEKGMPCERKMIEWAKQLTGKEIKHVGAGYVIVDPVTGWESEYRW